MARRQKVQGAWNTRATLIMEIEFESVDGIHQQCNEIIEKAREYGWPKKATLSITQPFTEELV